MSLILTQPVGSADSELLKVSSADTTAKYLQDAIATGTGIGLALLNAGANEQLQLTFNGALNDVADVDITTVADNELLAFDSGSGNWINQTPAEAGLVTSGDFTSHTSDATIHFTEASIDHTAIQNIGTNTHAQIDTHLADGTIHFTQAAISITESQISDLGTYIPTSEKAAFNGVATLDAGGKIPTGQLPALAITDVNVVASEIAQLALTVQEGDVAIRTDLNKSYVHNGGVAGTMADWSELLTPTDAVLSVNGQTGTVVLTTTNITEGTNLYYTNARVDARISLQVLDDHADVLITTPADNEVLAYNAGTTSWVNQTAAEAGLATISDVTTHTGNSGIHFAENAIDHTNIQNIGTNTHAQIDTHIADASVHFTEGTIDHTAIQNIGTNSHAQIDTHIADSSIHFTQAAISITESQISDLQSYSLDTHVHSIKDLSDVLTTMTPLDGQVLTFDTVNGWQAETIPASVTDHTLLSNIGTNTHAQIDTHIADASIHFTQAAISITESQISDLGTYIPTSEKGVANGVATLDAGGKIPTSQVPSIAITDVYVVADIIARNALTVQTGDVAKVTDSGGGLPQTYIYDGTAWVDIQETSDVISVNGQTGTVVLTTTDIAEGTNLYFTDARADARIALQTLNNHTDVSLSAPADNELLAYNSGTTSWINQTPAEAGLATTTDLSTHTSDATIHFTEASIDHTAIQNIGTNSHAQIDNHIADASIHFTQAAISITESQISDLQNYALVGHTHTAGDLTLSINDLTNVLTSMTPIDGQVLTFDTINGWQAETIPAGVTDHTLLTNIGTNSHAQIDTHIADASVHFTQAAISITESQISDLQNYALVGHTHTAGDLTLSINDLSNVLTGMTPSDGQVLTFDTTNGWQAETIPSGVTDHTLLTNIGTNTHAQIDTHIADATLHFTEASIDHTAIQNIGTNSHAQIDTHIADASIHFTQAAINITESQISDLGTYIPTSEKGVANGVATLDAGAKIPTSQLPALALTDVSVVANEAAQLALVAQEGDVAIRTDLNKSYAHNGGVTGTMADWSELLTPTDSVLSVNGQTGSVSVNLWETITGDTGSTTANTTTDTLNIVGGDGITTSVAGDTVTVTSDNPEPVNTVTNVTTTQTVDSVVAEMGKWIIRIKEVATPTNVFTEEILATHDGTNPKFTEYGILKMGSNITGLAVNVTLTGGNTLNVTVVSTPAVDVQIKRVAVF